MKIKNLSYLAGLIDGEGCLSAWRYWNDKRTDCNPYYQYSCRLNVTNTSLELMKQLIIHYGGSYRMTRPATTKHKARYEWRPKGKANLEKLLLGVIPHLLIKREQAELLLEWVRLGYDTHDRRYEIIQRLNILNRKGTVETDTPSASNEVMIQSELTGDCESDPAGTLDS